jgi:LPS sulfotransferase NodH
MPPTRAYLICSTPRSGSTFLCELLKSTGVAGRPEEYFEARASTGLPPRPRDYLDGLSRTEAGIRDDQRPPHAPAHSDLRGLDDYRQHLARTLRLGTTGNGVFGAKLMWRQLSELRALAETVPAHAGREPPDLLDRMLHRPAYVWVTRRDKVRQAISLWRALQTRIWRLEDGGPNGRTEGLRYSFEGIDHLVRALQADDEGWSSYFEEYGLAPLTVRYELDLERGAVAATRRVLDYIGVARPDDWQPQSTIRQSDALNQEWLAAYDRDRAARLVGLRAG